MMAIMQIHPEFVKHATIVSNARLALALRELIVLCVLMDIPPLLLLLAPHVVLLAAKFVTPYITAHLLVTLAMMDII